jgi:hypothetical protein
VPLYKNLEDQQLNSKERASDDITFDPPWFLSDSTFKDIVQQILRGVEIGSFDQCS